MKKTFKQILSEVPKPKQLMPDTKLPYVFDLFWDIKIGADILNDNFGYRKNKRIIRLLAEHGFDTRNLG